MKLCIFTFEVLYLFSKYFFEIIADNTACVINGRAVNQKTRLAI